MVVGIDMGGTSIKVGLVDEKGTVTEMFSLITKDYPEFSSFVAALADKVNPLKAKYDIKAVGIGCPNGNFYTGNIESAVNLPWRGTVPVARLVSEALSVPCRITNDANAAALGEMTYGAAVGLRDFIMITLGTGVGSGIVIDGRMVYGHDGFAGELGHVIVCPDGRLCGCGRKGCLEAYCSATGVARTACEFLAESSEPSSLRAVPSDAITSKDVFEAAVAGDALAKRVFDFTGEILGRALADFVTFSAPEAFVLFGGLARAGALLFDPVRESMERSLLPLWRGKIKVLPSQLPADDAAILGAASIAVQSL